MCDKLVSFNARCRTVSRIYHQKEFGDFNDTLASIAVNSCALSAMNSFLLLENNGKFVNRKHIYVLYADPT